MLMGKLELVQESDNLSIYSPKFEGENLTEFEKFLAACGNLPFPLRKDFDAIVSVISKMVNDCGARENLFRLEGGNIKAVPLFVERPRAGSVGMLRLYCIRISDRLLIIGNGGIKKTRTYQGDSVLCAFVDELRRIEHEIFLEAKKTNKDYDDFAAMKLIIETITINK